MNPRRTAQLAGALYLLTHVTSVGAVVLYGGTGLDDGAPLNGRVAVLTGGLLEVVLAAAMVGSAAALYSLLRDHRPGLSVAYVGLRTLEASVLVAGVALLLPVVAAPGTTESSALDPSTAAALRLAHDWTFLLGPGLLSPTNTVVIAWLLWRTGLIARWIPILGLFGAALIGATNLGVFFGIYGTQPLAAIPIFAWEIALALTLLTRGLRVRDPHTSARMR